MNRKKERRSLVLLALLLALLLSLLFSVCLGRYPITLKELAGILWSKVSSIKPFWTAIQETLLLQHRLPRVLLAALVGCCLSAAGASYQGVFQNPMAAPDILGASSAAGFGAALAIVLGLGALGIIGFAFAAGLLCVLLVIFLGNRSRGKGSLGLILAGIMLSSLFSAATSYIKLIADPADQLPAITYWLMGSLNGTQPRDIAIALPPMLFGLLPLFLLRWRMNLLTLGDEEAQSLGLPVKLLRCLVILCATLITAASVALSGMIGWVGLVVPHFARRLVGNNYQYLLPASMLLGGSFLVLVDTVARNAATTEIPIGILTAFLGAPFFLFLMTKRGERR